MNARIGFVLVSLVALLACKPRSKDSAQVAAVNIKEGASQEPATPWSLSLSSADLGDVTVTAHKETMCESEALRLDVGQFQPQTQYFEFALCDTETCESEPSQEVFTFSKPSWVFPNTSSVSEPIVKVRSCVRSYNVSLGSASCSDKWTQAKVLEAVTTSQDLRKALLDEFRINNALVQQCLQARSRIESFLKEQQDEQAWIENLRNFMSIGVDRCAEAIQSGLLSEIDTEMAGVPPEQAAPDTLGLAESEEKDSLPVAMVAGGALGGVLGFFAMGSYVMYSRQQKGVEDLAKLQGVASPVSTAPTTFEERRGALRQLEEEIAEIKKRTTISFEGKTYRKALFINPDLERATLQENKSKMEWTRTSLQRQVRLGNKTIHPTRSDLTSVYGFSPEQVSKLSFTDTVPVNPRIPLERRSVAVSVDELIKAGYEHIPQMEEEIRFIEGNDFLRVKQQWELVKTMEGKRLAELEARRPALLAEMIENFEINGKKIDPEFLRSADQWFGNQKQYKERLEEVKKIMGTQDVKRISN
ncbi:MAG: hypothetical protein HYW48_02365 [Deltaproteobacteria bacterium]|nr:hypothetical protein [Deltaproteobacteria bacterium]